jgi:membrane associated rhomboid family serine protease
MVATGVSWYEPKNTDLLKWGAEYGPETLSGQYWRVITAAFVHIGIIHILLNMWCLWSLGRLLERLVGPWATAGVYVVTGAGASLLSLSWDPMRISAGASGAIFGIAGALIPILYYGNLGLPKEVIGKLLGYVVRFSLINLLYGLRGGVNNMAHLGGLVSGLALGLLFARSFSLPREERGAQRRNVLIVGAAAMIALFFPIARAKSFAVDLHNAELALDQKDFDGAVNYMKKYLTARPNDPLGHALMGFAYQQEHRFDEAVGEYEMALKLEPNYRFVQANLAIVYVGQNEPKKAEPLCRRVVAFEPDYDLYLACARAYLDNGHLADARSTAEKAVGLQDKNQAAKNLLVEIEAQEKVLPPSQSN